MAAAVGFDVGGGGDGSAGGGDDGIAGGGYFRQLSQHTSAGDNRSAPRRAQKYGQPALSVGGRLPQLW